MSHKHKKDENVASDIKSRKLHSNFGDASRNRKDCDSNDDNRRPEEVRCESQGQNTFCVPISFDQELIAGTGGVFVPLSLSFINTDRIHGVLKLKFNSTLSRAGYRLYVYNAILRGNRIVDAHLHHGDAHENGPVIVGLFNSNGNPRAVNGLLSQGIIENRDIAIVDNNGDATGFNSVASLFERIREGHIYVNVHNEQFPNGVIRGQIFPKGGYCIES